MRLQVSPLEICEEYTVYGPYLDKKQNRWIVVFSFKDRKTSKSYARWYVEKYWRKLSKDEEVDHIDGNTLNNDPSNFQILEKLENIRKSYSFTRLHKLGKKNMIALNSRKTPEERKLSAAIAGSGNKGKTKSHSHRENLSKAAKIQWQTKRNS